MNEEQELVSGIKVGRDDPRFLRRLFFTLSRKLKKDRQNDPIGKIAAEEFGSYSRRFEKSQFQDPSLSRNLLLARQVATVLVTDSGELDLELLPKMIEELKVHAYFLGPGWEDDAPRQEQMIFCLETLLKDKSLQRQVRSISRPHSHKGAEQLIRDTLLLPESTAINDAQTRRAAVSAWLTSLRQNVGSCFATAPAILVQREQPSLFFRDLDELLSTGQLKRVAGGVQYAAPLAMSWGAGDLRKPVIAESTLFADFGLSPGLMIGLEWAGVIDSVKPLKERILEAQEAVINALEELQPMPNALFPTNAEEILRKILLRKFGLEEKDLKEYLERPKVQLFSGMLMQQPPIGHGMGKKGEACASMLAKFERAKAGFKSVQENALLKSWEFTLASFAETKPGFTRWNMYASLGFSSEEPGGIGECLYVEIKELLDRANRKVEEVQQEYEILYSQLVYAESRLRNASSESEAQWIRADYEAKRNSFRSLEEIRDREHFKAKRFANLLADLLGAYDDLFPLYFQEIYDPDMHEVTTAPYEDSPAGFRLLYKYGRSNTSQWTLIYTPEEFVDALASFFVATETELIHKEEFQGLQEVISELVTKIVQHVKGDSFLRTAFDRMAKAHNVPAVRDPLNHLDKVQKKPWAYTSGGTMGSLISSYFRLDRKPSEKERWVENEPELILFLVDIVKQLSAKTLEGVLNFPERKLLMHSPTHAFLLSPSFPEFRDTVVQEQFTYTYVRDQLILPSKRFLESIELDREMMEEMISLFIPRVPKEQELRFRSLSNEFYGIKSPMEFRSALALGIEQDRVLSPRGQMVIGREEIDRALFEWLPFTPVEHLRESLEAILLPLPGAEDKVERLKEVIRAIEEAGGQSRLISSKQLRELCKSALLLAFGATSFALPYSELIVKRMQQLRLACPVSFRFADTNWQRDYFAFLVNPGTGDLELWRVNREGSTGAPMRSWSIWLNGTRRDRTWGVYDKLHEYCLT